MGEKLSNTVTLTTPSGSSWIVELTEADDGIILQNGWQEFVKDLLLKEENVLIFRYDRSSSFEVLMFDQTSCEKKNSYFVRKCSMCKEKEGRRSDISLETVPVRNAHCSTSISKKMSRKDREESTQPPAKKSSSKKRKVPRVTDSEVEEDHAIGEVPSHPNPAYARPSRSLLYRSKRREVTEEEKKETLQLAEEAARKKERHFIVVMKPTQVSNYFYMSIPKSAVRNYFPHKSQDISLRTNGKIWVTRYQFKPDLTSTIFGNGWAHFVLENNLEVGDVCLFEPVEEEQNGFVLDVSVYRVVKECVPLEKLRFKGLKG
ncbi:hypothetical protein GIB67_015934 [Kingdonia uniflora]|uniref:TF-B3 domain-containing protein n=1 Tax=Kingdonia uniflora TaxID=39325 RepID=A0A7J7PCA6_9MAGN|nr:hypothetical protein GIB67_015934 [Kingdonia uniflora]